MLQCAAVCCSAYIYIYIYIHCRSAYIYTYIYIHIYVYVCIYIAESKRVVTHSLTVASFLSKYSRRAKDHCCHKHRRNISHNRRRVWYTSLPPCTRCNTLQHTATHCNTLQHTATHCNTLTIESVSGTHLFPHCNTLQYTAAHCSTLQHIATDCSTLQHTYDRTRVWYILVITLQHTATQCHALQHTTAP